MKILLLNGPPGCGKDTIAKMLLGLVPGALHRKFSSEVKRRTHKLMGFDVPDDWFEKFKDEPSNAFEGVSPRAAYIQFSEAFAKPLWGPSIFGTWALKNLLETTDKHTPLVVFSDSGFREEALVLWEEYGKEVIRTTIWRDGCSFDKDSRSYWNAPQEMAELSIFNNGTFEELHDILKRVVVPAVMR